MTRTPRTLTLTLAALAAVVLPATSAAQHRARAAQAPAPAQSVGSVVAFADGVLTIEVADGSRVSGALGPRARVLCSSGLRVHGLGGGAFQARTSRHGGDRGRSEGQGAMGASGATGATGATGPTGGPQRGHGRRFWPCDPATLKLGTKVLAARLVLTPDGPVWRLVVFLVPPVGPAGTTGPTGPTGPIGIV